MYEMHIYIYTYINIYLYILDSGAGGSRGIIASITSKDALILFLDWIINQHKEAAEII